MIEIKSSLRLFEEKKSSKEIEKEILNLSNLIDELKQTVKSFNQRESEFLQKSYIEFINIGVSSILNLGSNFPKAGYLFIGRFFENNIKTFYNNFALKEKIILNEPKFSSDQSIPAKDILKGDDLNTVSLYIFIENIAIRYEKFSGDRALKDEFKQKLINLYSQIYEIFQVLSKNLLSQYFNITLNNHPMMLIELIKTSLSSESIESVAETFSEENAIFTTISEDDGFEILDRDSLIEFISIIFLKNSNLSSFIYSKNSVSILNSVFNENIETFSSFVEFSKIFLEKFKVKNYSTKLETILYFELFFKFILSFSDENLAKNTLFMGSIGVGKSKAIKEIIEIKNINRANYEILSLNPSYSYENLMDGYVNGKFLNGEFKQMCIKAINNPDENYYMFLENIHNSDMNSLFCEISRLLDERYSKANRALLRTKNSYIIDTLEEKEEFSVVVENGKSYFAIPENLYVIATFDVNHNSIPLNFLTKFNQIHLKCDYQAILFELKEIKNARSYVEICQKINEIISSKTGEDIVVGHNIFIRVKNYLKESHISVKTLNDFYEKELKMILKSLLSKHLSNLEVKELLSSIKSYLGRI
ncbi:MAG: hypothetical protein GX282_01340 [Campylobacteraceae bacterium]|nr:hypothetical protein [Campylobacteraceae bacterium]